jgi:hypothetical protein
MPRPLFVVYLLLAGIAFASFTGCSREGKEIDTIAESYVKLTLEIALYDPDFVDAYYGPPEWKPAPLDSGSAAEIPADELCRRSDELLQQLAGIDVRDFSDMELRRLKFLEAHIRSAKARVQLVSGKKMSFNQESKALYGAVAPKCDTDSLDATLEELESLIPGSGTLPERIEAYRAQFVIPGDLVDTVFTAAIEEVRRRTREHIEMPEGESFDVEYVTDASWGAYNWYKGKYRSLIQVNVGLPFYIGSPLRLAAHEGYPGHHVQNILIEKHLLRDRGWMEYSVQPLYCPQATINEGGANYGISIAFSEEEELAFMRDVLFPLAGLDPSRAEEYRRYQKLTARLRAARVEPVRRYLDGRISREEAVEFLCKYGLYSPERAERYIRFAEHYRSYVVTYTVGEDLVKAFIESRAESAEDPAYRWELLRDLYAVPHLPSHLQ